MLKWQWWFGQCFINITWGLPSVRLLTKSSGLITNSFSLSSLTRWDVIPCLTVTGWYYYTPINWHFSFSKNVCEINVFVGSKGNHTSGLTWREYICVYGQGYVFESSCGLSVCDRINNPNKMWMFWLSTLALMWLFILPHVLTWQVKVTGTTWAMPCRTWPREPSNQAPRRLHVFNQSK